MQLSEQRVASEVRDWLVREFLYVRPEQVITDDESLIASGVIDSMGVLELVLFLEQAFGVEVADHQVTADNIGTVGNIARFVLRSRPAT